MAKEAPLLAALAGRTHDDAPPQNALPQGCFEDRFHASCEDVHGAIGAVVLRTESPIPSLLSMTDRDAILTRLRQLEPARQPLWGRFTAPAMICHLADQLRVATGRLPTRRHDTLPRRTLLKWLVIYSPMRAPPGKVQTAPEMLSSAPTTWAADLAAVEVLIHGLASTPTTAVHPFFGPLSHGEWARLTWKHLDHHLRQFAC